METQNVVLLLFYASTCFGLAKLFPPAGQEGWKAWVPVYNWLTWLKIIQKPWWWLFLLVTPGVNLLMMAIMSVLLAKTFNRKSTPELWAAALIGFVYIPYLGLQKNLQFTGVPDPAKQKRTWQREWTEAILFAVIAASVIRTFFIEAFTIPTSSLEKTLMVGDYLFVSKVSYGAKSPMTPIAFPFAHHTIPGVNIKAYLEWIKLPYFRLPGLGSVKNNDLVVFNYPDGDTVFANPDLQNQSYYQVIRDHAALFRNEDLRSGRPAKPFNDYMGAAYQYTHVANNRYAGSSGWVFGGVIPRPQDKRENYIKRCVAIPGDNLEIKNGELSINGQKSYVSENMQHTYRVKIEGGFLPPQVRDELDITERIQLASNVDPELYDITLSYKSMEKLKTYPFIKSITPVIDTTFDDYSFRIFPHHANYRWNVDNFGPLTMPKEGETIQVDTGNICLYDRIITAYEHNTLEIKNGKIVINGQETNTYTFKQGYYWMMGDNRHNSADSRFWGFVPEDHIVGKAVFVWMSLKDEEHNGSSGALKLKTFFTNHGKARWERFFTFVSNDGLSRSYFPHFLVIVGGIYGFNYFKRRRKSKTEAKK